MNSAGITTYMRHGQGHELSVGWLVRVCRRVGFVVVSYRGRRVVMLRVDQTDRKSTRLNSSHIQKSRMPSSA